MAVGHVASASSGSQASVASFNIGTLGTGARAGIVFVANHSSATDIISGVTWNGVAMTKLYSAADTNTEPGCVVAFFLDNVTNGTITVSRTNNANITVGYAASISAGTGRFLEVAQVKTIGGGGTVQTNANASEAGTAASGEVAVDDGSPGTNSLRYACAFSGAATPPANGTNSTNLQLLDSTALGSRFVRETNAGQGSRNVGFATGTTDDWAMVAVAVREGFTTETASFTADAVIKKTVEFGQTIWTESATNSGQQAQASWYGNGYWVKAGSSGNLAYQATTATGSWTNNAQGSTTFENVHYGNGYWVAVGASGVLYYKATNPTGAWTSNTQGSSNFRGLWYGNGYWVAVGVTGTLYYKATDPTGAWTSNTQGSSQFNDVYYANGYWVAVGNGGTLYYATDPTGAWTSNTQGATAWAFVRYHNGYWILAGGAGSTRYRQGDPTGSFTDGPTLASVSSFTGLDTDGTSMVAVGGTYIHRSRDPWRSWDVQLLGSISRNGATYGNGEWLIVSTSSSVGQLVATDIFPTPMSADAIIKREQTGSFTANAILKRTMGQAASYRSLLATFGATTHWPLGETSSVYDDVLGSADLTANGSPTRGVVGALSVDDNKAVTFSSTSDYLEAADATVLDLGDTNFSISLFVKHAYVNNILKVLLNKRNGSVSMFLDESERFAVGKAGVEGFMRTVASVPDNAWAHLVWARTGPGLTSNDLYINGVLQEKTTVVGDQPNNSLVDNNSVLEVGREGAALSLLGSLDELAFHKGTVLTSHQVATLYAAASGAGTFSADAVLAAGATVVNGSFTANAVLFKTISASFTANAVLKKTMEVGARLFLDTFTDADGTQLEDHTSDSGDDWTEDATNDLQVVSNRATNPGANGWVRSVGITAKNQDVRFRAGGITEATASELNVVARQYPSFSGGLGINWGDVGEGNVLTALLIGPLGSGGSVPTTVALDDQPHDIRLRATDQSLQLYIDGAYIGSVSLPSIGTIPAGGDLALYLSGEAWVDDLEVFEALAFQGDAVLKRERTGSFTANAVIKATVAGSLTADAVTKREQTGSFTANAVIKREASGSFTANAITKREQSTSLTADAVLKATIASSFTANAITKREQSATFTANAVIRREASGSFTANAVLLKAIGGSLTANAVLFKTISGSFTANACIATVFFEDDFNRSVPQFQGLGGRWQYDRSASGQMERVYVDGSVAIYDAPDNSSVLDSYFTGIPIPAMATMYFDVFVDPTTPQNAFVSSIGTQIELLNRGFGEWRLIVGGTPAVLDFYPPDPAWYRVKVSYSATGSFGKVWKIGDAEPEWMVTNGLGIDRFTADGTLRIALEAAGSSQSNVGYNISFDNYRLLTVSIDATTRCLFSADAVLGGEQTGSFTANAIIKREATSSFTANSVIKREQVGAFTADAVIFRTIAGSFSADAVLRRERTGSLTADAVLVRTIAGSLTADAITLRTQAASFTADAILRATVNGSFTADAVIRATLSGSLTADAVTKKTASGSFTQDAVFLRERNAVANADAIVLRTQAGTPTADAVIFRIIGGSYSADAVLMPRFRADAVILRTQAASFSADAVIMPRFTADAILLRTQQASFSADAWILGEGVFGFAANAVLYREQSGQFDGNSVLKREFSATFTADAVIRREITAGSTADAVLKREQTASVTGDAILLAGRTGGLTSDAVLRSQISGSFTADAVLKATISPSFTADAVLAQAGVTGFTLDAIIEKEQSASVAADAVIRRVGEASATADAAIQAQRQASLTADSVLARTLPQGLSADAIIRTTSAASLTADAFITNASVGFTANAVLLRPSTQSFSANAVLKVVVQGQLDAEAVLRSTHAASSVADAVVKRTVGGSVASNAIKLRTNNQSFATDSVLRYTSIAGFSADAVIAVESYTFVANAVIAKTWANGFTADAWFGNTHAVSISATLGAATISAALATPTISGTLTGSTIRGSLRASTISGELSVDTISGTIEEVI